MAGWVASNRGALAALGAAIAAPVFQILAVGFPHAYDSRLHVLWSHSFARQLWQGEPYPRWLVDVGEGFGSPVFFHYPPLPYYVTALFQPLAPEPESAPLRLALGTALALVLSALACFAWLRRRLGAGSAAFGAAVYTLLPYHILIDVWLRGAYAELWAFVWLPVMLLAVEDAAVRPRRAFVGGAAATAALLLSHPPTALTAVPLVALWAWIAARGAGSRGAPAVAAGGMLLGFGLAAPYLATALTHGAYVNQGALFEGTYVYSRSFLFAEMPLSGRPWVQNGALAMVALAVVAALGARSAPPAVRSLARFAGAASALYLFLMTPLSQPVWVALPLLQKIQFPWRMSLELALLSSAAAAVLLDQAQRRWPRSRRRLAGVAAAVVVCLLVPTLGASPHKRMKPSRLERYLQENRNQPEHVVLHERDPRPLLHDGARVAFVEGSGVVQVETWRPRRIELRVVSDGPARLAVRQQAYPGWQADLAGASIPADVLAAWGVVGIDLPAGTHRLSLTLGPTPHERAGWTVGAVSLAFAAVAWQPFRRARRPAGRAGSPDQAPRRLRSRGMS